MKDHHLLRPMMLALTALVTLGLSGCGTTSAAPPRGVPSVPKTRAQPKPKRTSAKPSPHSSAPHAPWPTLVLQSLGLIQGHTAVALMGPASVPRGNSAKVSFSASQYTVNVFQCPAADPINSSAIGHGLCGAMASFAEGFGATRYPSHAAAQAALAYQPPSGTPVTMSLPGGLTGSRWRISGQTGPHNTATIVWHEGNWTLVVSGGPPEQSSALLVTHLLQHYRLPPHTGLLTVDVAGDGLHTSVQWVLGSTVYFTSAMHNPAHAIIMAASIEPFDSNS